MMWHTHLAFGLLFGLVSMPFLNSGNAYLFIALVLLGALLPDIDQHDSFVGKRASPVSNIVQAVFGHRGIVHSIWGMAAICGLFWYFFSRSYGAALALGFFSHLIADGLTKKGINFLHPFGNARISGFIETGSSGERILFIVILALCAMILI